MLMAIIRASADLPHLVAEPHRAPVAHHLGVAHVLLAHARAAVVVSDVAAGEVDVAAVDLC
jgi:hypothetical protein